MRMFVGTSGFSYKEWKGSFYPTDLSDKQMLRYYGERFRTVEINNTFYRMPKRSVLEGWAHEVPGDFRFVLKAPRQITHIMKLKDVHDPLMHLLEVAGSIKEQLGPFLFQIPPFLKKDIPSLQEFLALLPENCRAAFEFRHPSWFEEEVFSVLSRRRAALCIAQADNDLEVPLVATTDWGYLRLRKSGYGDVELKSWAERIQGQKWSEVFVFFKHEEKGKGPQEAQRFLELAG